MNNTDLKLLHEKIDGLSSTQKVHYGLIIVVGIMVAYSIFFS